MPTLPDIFKSKLNLIVLPGGRWTFTQDGKKPIDAQRSDTPETNKWSAHPTDNMGRLFLQNNYLVVDVDGLFSHQTQTHLVLTTGEELPITFYTYTSSKQNIHAYYHYPAHKVPTRTKSIVGHKVDTFTYGTVFEGHSHTLPQSSNSIPNPDLPITSLPENHPYLKTLYNMPNYTHSTPGEIMPTSNPTVYHAVKTYMKSNFLDLKKGPKNKYIRQILPYKYQPKEGRPDLSKTLNLDYSLINDVAAKLSGVAELSTAQLEAFLRLFIQRYGLDPDYKDLLSNNILATLPSRDAIKVIQPDDGLLLEEMMAQQAHTMYPIFRTSSVSGREAKLAFIRLDKVLKEPVPFNGSFLIERKLAEVLNPERQRVDEAGKPTYWDDQVSLVEIINDPTQPAISYNDLYPVVNIALKTEYMKQVTPHKTDTIEQNLIYKAYKSIVPKEYLELILTWTAQVIWAPAPPIMVPIVATSESTEGGTGKSIITLSIISKILGTAAAALDSKTFSSGWGDTLVGKKLISLEDLEKQKSANWDMLSAQIKRLFSGAQTVLNMKGSHVTQDKLTLSMSISSNHLIPILNSDRRSFCLEPAHLDPTLPNKPLSLQDSEDLDILIISDSYSEPLQEFTNYLYYIYQQPLSTEMHSYLYRAAPHTKYRNKWLGANRSYSARIPSLLSLPDDLLALIPDTSYQVPDGPSFRDLLVYLTQLYSHRTHKVPLSWKWFQYMIACTGNEELLEKSKTSVAQAMAVEFKPTGLRGKSGPYLALDTLLEKSKLTPDCLHQLPLDGLLVPLEPQIIERYTAIIQSLT